jgi:hypothetical protein
MALKTIEQLRNFFRTGLKPTQQQFWDVFDSFRHIGDNLTISDVSGLQSALDSVGSGPVSQAVSGTGTYVVPANTLLQSVSAKVTTQGNVKIGSTIGGGEFLDEIVEVGQAVNVQLGMEIEADYTIYLTGNFTVKIYTQ